jgi:hypothetical protein
MMTLLDNVKSILIISIAFKSILLPNRTTRQLFLIHIFLIVVLQFTVVNSKTIYDRRRLEQKDNHNDGQLIEIDSSHHRRHYHHHHHYHLPEQYNTIKSRSATDHIDDNYTSLTISGFVDSNEEQICATNLQRSDANNDLKIDSAEFTKFIEYQSNGKVTEESYTNLHSMFILTFLSTACLTCFEETSDGNCCLGTNAHIPIDNYIGQETNEQYLKTLFAVCIPVIEKIDDINNNNQQPPTIQTASPSTFPNTMTPQTPTILTQGPIISPMSSPQTSAPVQIPSLPLSMNPIEPTQEPIPLESIPTNSPSSKVPTISPLQGPSSIPTTIPSTIPTTRPSQSPFTIPSSTPTNRPSLVPSTTPQTLPSNIPTDTPSQIPSFQPTVKPSNIPSSRPSIHPSHFPSELPSLEPSNLPSHGPSAFPSQIPLHLPTMIPIQPVPSLDCISFSYMIKGLNYTANDIMLGINNTIRQGLEQATRDLMINIFNTTYPQNTIRLRRARSNSTVPKDGLQDRTHESIKDGQDAHRFTFSTTYSSVIFETTTNLAFRKAYQQFNMMNRSAGVNTSTSIRQRLRDRQHSDSQQSSLQLASGLRTPEHQLDEGTYHPNRKLFQHVKPNRQHRRLVYFTDMYPVTITRIIDFPMNSNTTDLIPTNSYIVSSYVCYIIEQNDNVTDIRTTLTSQLKEAFLNGNFTNSFPQRNTNINTAVIP